MLHLNLLPIVLLGRFAIDLVNMSNKIADDNNLEVCPVDITVSGDYCGMIEHHLESSYM